jgi:hypothetical protein
MESGQNFRISCQELEFTFVEILSSVPQNERGHCRSGLRARDQLKQAVYGAFIRTGFDLTCWQKMVMQPWKASIIVLEMPGEGFLSPFLRYFFRLKAIAAMSMTFLHRPCPAPLVSSVCPFY